MTTNLTDYKHIAIDHRGVPIIAGSTLKVIDLVMAQIAYGWTPAEIHINHRDLSRSQIHSALAYYWEHRDELDQAIQADGEFAQKMREKAGDSPFVTRLKAQAIK
ncbi:MAG: DUF433 domain-containing protein [Microcystis aeruginosa Ma_QC_C_20070703_M131]|uniref:DUF433 domain-containing protein n=1 Tax=Microcystis aeruginosa Ma_QC_C_20070703_M131 TaxID=2486263 RepID=A0A551YI15_MICAE|nr:MAG: DUF433 domain-containing protein [Microcystis aeruginosa Ma_QC_C_20070703_M131]